MVATKRMVVDESLLGEHLFMRVGYAVGKLCEAHNLFLTDGEPMSTTELPHSMWVDAVHPHTWIRLSEDDNVPAAYLDVTMPTVERCEAACELLAQHVKVYEHEQLRELAREHMHAEPKWLIRFGLGAITFDEQPDVVGVVSEGLACGKV